MHGLCCCSNCCGLRADGYGVLLASPCVERKRFAQFEHLALDAVESIGLGAMLERFGDPGADLQHLRLFHASRSDGRRTDADAAGLERWIGVERDGVLVDGDAGESEGLFGFTAEHAL